jgi:hypothetical protein
VLAQVSLQAPLSQLAVEFAGCGQLTQFAPQLVLLSASQLAPLSQARVFAGHCTPQLPVVPLAVHVAVPPLGFGHAVQLVPQVSAEPFETQMPLQACRPASQVPLQAMALAMHLPAHSLVPLGQLWTQLKPSQATLPPSGFWHGLLQRCGPQWFRSFSGTQAPPHRCRSGSHLRTQAPFSQRASPNGSVGHCRQLGPQAVASSFRTQASPQRWCDVAHEKSQLEPLQEV